MSPRHMAILACTREKQFPRGFLSRSLHALQTVVNHTRILWKNIKTRLDNRIGSVEVVFWWSIRGGGEWKKKLIFAKTESWSKRGSGEEKKYLYNN